jgi:hypothetical protein
MYFIFPFTGLSSSFRGTDQATPLNYRYFMAFFLDTAWWLVFAAAAAASSAVALMKPVKPLFLIAAGTAWGASIAWSAIAWGAISALAAGALSLAFGLLLFLLVLLLTGVKLMAKKRYG